MESLIKDNGDNNEKKTTTFARRCSARSMEL